MKDFHIVLAALTSIILFVFGLENFSKEVQNITGERFRKFLTNATKYSGVGVLIGAVMTAIIQSSSATSVIAISLVNAGVLSFTNSLGIIFGANIGTTVTAQLVAFKLTAFAPAFIILGFVLSFIKTKYSIFAKSIFYFGFVFFSLNLISSTLSPLQNDERLIGFLTGQQSPALGVLIGALVTALVQSSSVTTGLAIIFTQQGLMSLDNAIPILMGANIGTTVTALLSIISMDISAKKTALAHFLFNFGGVLIFLPIIYFVDGRLFLNGEDPSISLATFHLVFNVITTIVFVFLSKPFGQLIDKIMGEGKMDFERFDLSFMQKTESFDEVDECLTRDLSTAYHFVQENYNLVTLSIETNYKGVYDTARKRIEYFDFFRGELMNYFATFLSHCTKDKELERFMKLMSMYEYIFQIHDSVKDLTSVKDAMDKSYIELKSDILLIVREISSKTLSFFDHMAAESSDKSAKKELRKMANQFQNDLESFNKNILEIMAKPERRDAGAVLHLITYSQRLKDKLVNYHNLITSNYKKPEEQIKIDVTQS